MSATVEVEPGVASRVLIVSWEYPPLIEGGLARHVCKLSEALVDLGVEVHVLTRGGKDEPVEEVAGGVSVRRVHTPAPPADLDEFVAWVEQMNADMTAAGVDLGDRFDFDLVHGHDWLVADACRRLARRFDAPLVTTIHATEYGRHQGWVKDHPQSYIHGIERRMAKHSRRVITCSDFMRDQVVEVFGVPRRRITAIPNGIDPADLPRPGPEQRVRLRAEFARPGERLVLLVGRLVYEKGFQVALEAMPKVIDQVPGTRFLIVGSGPHEAELKKEARKLRLGRRIRFLGWVGDDALPSLYAIADLTVVPSIYEPFGLVALEAMASGCPCIVADTGGLREVVPRDEAGLRFRAGDPEALAAAAVRVLNDPDLATRLTDNAEEHVRRFDWADVAARTATLYAEVAPSRPQGSARAASGSAGS